MTYKTTTKSSKFCKCACKWRCKCYPKREKKPSPPFNSSLKRDPHKYISVHPKFIRILGEAPDVGTYHPTLRKGARNLISWRNEVKAKEFSENLGGRNARSQLRQKNLTATAPAPGSHDVKLWPDDVIHDIVGKNIRPNIGFGTVTRFESHVKSITPGPGCTVKVHNPYYYLEQSRHKGRTLVPSFEFDGLKPRFGETKKSSTIPCNRYNVKEPTSIDTFLKKTTGKRGPYDLFTGPRDESTIKGYLATVKTECKSWPVALPSEVDKLLHTSTYYKGRLSPFPRFPKISGLRMALKDISMCYKDPKFPGPGHYDPKSPRKPRNRKSYPFDSNIENVRPLPVREMIHPGPTRYTIKDVRLIKGNGWTCIFKSKVPRTIGANPPVVYNSF